MAELPPEHRIVKILLLGAGECGKSTIAKQMKIIHDKGFDKQQRETFRQLVLSNVTTGLATILQQMEYLDIKYESSNIMPQALNFLNIDEGRK